MTAVDLLTCSRLLDMIAGKLGHDWLMLRFGTEPLEKKYVSAVFRQYENYDTEPLEVDGKPVLIKYYADAEDLHARSNADMYSELCKRLYAILESGGKLSDGKSEVDASAVPEFMLGCVLRGLA